MKSMRQILITCPIILLFSLTSLSIFSQATITVGGIITSSNGEPLAGATVQVKGENSGTIADIDGNYSIAAIGTDTLIFDYLGFSSEFIGINGRTTINVSLREEGELLDEVVVVAYGQVKKSDLTGSVSSVSGEELNRIAPVSIDQALQGRAAGVQVTQVSGRPGGETSIRIRGSSSINAGNEPLYVVDGMLITSDNNETNVGGAAGASLNGLASINPNEIESIEILKDASATAMYGSRGANGVILITTKRGREGESTVSFDAYYGMQRAVKQLDVLNGENFAHYINAYNTDAGFPLDPRYIIPDKIGEGTNWQDAIFRDAPMQSYQLGFRGGSAGTRYSISGGYFLQDGIIINSNFERYNFRVNLDKDLSKRVTVGSNLSLSHIYSDGVLTGSQGAGLGLLLPGAMASSLLFPPTQPVLDPDVEGGYTYEDDRGRNIGNPVADARETDNLSKNSRVIGNMYAQFGLAEGLNFKASIGIDGFSVKENRFVPNYLKRTEPNNGEAVVATVDGFTWLAEFTMNYDTRIEDDHQLNALAGYTIQGFESERVFSWALDFPDNRTGYHSLGSALNPQPTFNGENSWGIISYLGRVNYIFDNRFLLTLTGRLDGSSKFGENNKYGFFPSASVAWKLHEEDFFSNMETITSLKARLSYGVIGNQEIAPYSSLSTVGPLGQGVFNNTEPYIGQEPLRFPNPNLKWERTNQLDFGVDAELYEGRLALTADYYTKVTTDLLLNTPLPTTTGFVAYLANIGELKNTGVELSVNSRNLTGDFSWETTFNIGHNKNEILSLVDGEDIPVGGVLHVPAGWSLLREGEAIGTFYGLISDGIFQTNEEASNSPVLSGQNAEAGDRRYRDINGRDENGKLTGTPDGRITEADRTILGNAQPDFTYGLTNNFSYKSFDLSVYIQGAQGNEMVNAYLFDLGALHGETNVLTEFWENRWTPENPTNEYPRVNPNERNIFSDAQIEDASYLRIKNITLGYTLPARISQKALMRSARIYVSANNIHTFTKYRGYDPEVNAFGQSSLLQGIDYGGYPPAKSIIGGIQIQF